MPGGAIIHLLNDIPKNITWINAGSELQNGFIAQVYGQYKNTLGVLIVTHGPGIMTAISSIRNAVNENNPLLIISGYTKSNSEDFQHVDIKKVLLGVTKHHFFVDSQYDFEYKCNKAIKTAKLLNTAVVLTLVDGVEKLPYFKDKFTFLRENKLKFDNVDYVKKRITKNLNNKDKLLVVIGKGNILDYKSINDFIKNNNLPYITTWKGRVVFDGGIYCGRIGTLGHHSANYALYHSKNILVVGNLSGGLTSDFYENRFSVSLLTENKNVFTLSNRHNTILKNSDESYIIENFSKVLSNLSLNTSDSWKRFLNKSNKNLPKKISAKSQLEIYCKTAADIYDKLNLDINVCTGVGNHWYAIGKYMNIKKPNRWHSPTNWSSIGVGVANGIGMYLANKKPVWIFEGDGGFLFSASSVLFRKS